jgi:pyridoxal phosphate enzyme (YggS family)
MPAGADIAHNLESVRRRIAEAAGRAHRSPPDIRLIAVSKTFDAEAIRAAAAAGQRAFGENRVQEGLGKITALESLGLDWHLIGPLQSNKARKAATAFAWIHTIESIEVLTRIDDAARQSGARPQVLIQVDLAHEVTKHGAREAAVSDLVHRALDARGVDLRGLMTVPPIPTDPEESRPWFRQLREVRDHLVAAGIPAPAMRELSMGMSHDFEVAIDEGATMVRVGTAIFGRRTPTAPA